MFSKNDLVKIYNLDKYDIGLVIKLNSSSSNSFFGLQEDYINDGWETYSILTYNSIIEYDVNINKDINYIEKI